MRYACPALATAMFLTGLPAGCSMPDEPAPAGAELWRESAPSDPASTTMASVLSDDMTDAERRFVEKLPQLATIQARFEPELFAHRGVSSIGIGLARDRVTPVFRVVVSNPALRQVLPRTVEGVAVEIHDGGDVRLMDGGPACEGGDGYPCHNDKQTLPVEMGNSGAWILGPACTMGFKACDLETGESVIVTNSHCAQYPACGLAPIGNSFTHPALDDANPANAYDTIGQVAGHAAPTCSIAGDNYTDATKATSAATHSSRDIRDIGTPKNVPGSSIPGNHVHYSGRTSGYNRGEITAVNVTVVVPAMNGFCCGSLIMRDQVSFTPENPVYGGDSGSGVLLRGGRPMTHNRIAGLLYGSDGTNAYYNHINRVLDALDLTLDFTECGGPG